MRQAFVLIFFALICLPLVLLLGGVRIRPLQIIENRTPVAWEELAKTRLKHLPRKLDDYFSDQLGLRSHFVAGYLKGWELGLRAPVLRYQTGKEGELFMHQVSPTVLPALGADPPGAAHLRNLRLACAGTQAFFELRGIPYLLVMEPDKPTLYPEWLPFWAGWRPGVSRYALLQEALRDSGVNVLDMLPILAEAKATQRLYDRMYDTCHWNANALVLAYRRIGEELARWRPSLAPRAETFELEERRERWGQYGSENVPMMRVAPLSGMRDRSAELEEKWDVQEIRAVEHPADNQDFLWFMSDSYFRGTHVLDQTQPYVTPFVHHVAFYLSSHCGLFSPDLGRQVLAERRPVAVVDAFAERTLGPVGRVVFPEIRILADLFLHVPHVVVPEGVNAGKTLELPALEGGREGLVSVMARVKAPADGFVSLSLLPANGESGETARQAREKAGTEGLIWVQALNAGENLVHLHGLLPAGETATPILTFSGTGPHEFLPLPREILDYRRQKAEGAGN